MSPFKLALYSHNGVRFLLRIDSVPPINPVKRHKCKDSKDQGHAIATLQRERENTNEINENPNAPVRDISTNH